MTFYPAPGSVTPPSRRLPSTSSPSPPRLTPPLLALASEAFCGCARPYPIINFSLLKTAGIGPKLLRPPGRGGAYSRFLIRIGGVGHSPTEVLCVVGSGEGKIVMAAAILAEKVSSAGCTQGFLLGEAPGGGHERRKVEEMPGCWARKAQTL